MILCSAPCRTSFFRTKMKGSSYCLKGKTELLFITFAAPPITWSFLVLKLKVRAATIICGSTHNEARHVSVSPLTRFDFTLSSSWYSGSTLLTKPCTFVLRMLYYNNLRLYKIDKIKMAGTGREISSVITSAANNYNSSVRIKTRIPTEVT